MRVFVTGADGYIGAVLVDTLLAEGHEVVGLDTGFYVDGWLETGAVAPRPALRKDVRDVAVEELRGFEAVVHLAELSNDPLGQLDPSVTYDINCVGSVTFARRAKAAGVGRFVYSSSCSVYGASGAEERTERCPVAPQTAYAHCKVLVEQALTRLADDRFSPTVLRNATAFGASPRMRFDLVLNNLAGLAWTERAIRMTSDGTPWRPLVHVRDIAAAAAAVLAADRDAVHDEIFNVGDDAANYRVRDIADIVARAFPGCALSVGAANGDTRSYRVSFRKIAERLSGFRCQHDATAGARELHALFARLPLTPELFQHRAFTRLRQLEHLLQQGEIDERFFRVAAVPEPVAA